MSTYCTYRDVRAALSPDADPTDIASAASLEDWQIEDAITEAEGIVNAHLLARYTIPTSEIEVVENSVTNVYLVAPSPVRGWTRSIAAYLVTLTYMRNKDVGEDDPVRLRFNIAMNMLVAIRDRKMNLPTDLFPVTVAPDDQGVAVFNQYEGTLFHGEDLGVVPETYAYPQIYIPRDRFV